MKISEVEEKCTFSTLSLIWLAISQYNLWFPNISDLSWLKISCDAQLKSQVSYLSLVLMLNFFLPFFFLKENWCLPLDLHICCHFINVSIMDSWVANKVTTGKWLTVKNNGKKKSCTRTEHPKTERLQNICSCILMH